MLQTLIRNLIYPVFEYGEREWPLLCDEIALHGTCLWTMMLIFYAPSRTRSCRERNCRTRSSCMLYKEPRDRMKEEGTELRVTPQLYWLWVKTVITAVTEMTVDEQIRPRDVA